MPPSDIPFAVYINNNNNNNNNLFRPCNSENYPKKSTFKTKDCCQACVLMTCIGTYIFISVIELHM